MFMVNLSLSGSQKLNPSSNCQMRGLFFFLSIPDTKKLSIPSKSAESYHAAKR